jgi:hypothetical protein
MSKKKEKTEVNDEAEFNEELNSQTTETFPENESEVIEAETELLDEDAEGNRYLPGQEVEVPVEIKPLIDKVREIEKVLKPNFAKSRDALVAAKDKVSELAHANIQYFSEPDEKGTRVYKHHVREGKDSDQIRRGKLRLRSHSTLIVGTSSL